MPFTTNPSEKVGSLPDAALIAGTAQGEERHFDELMRRYKAKLFSFANKYTRDEEAALDIVQETFVRIFSHSQRFDPTYAASTWIFNITLNLCRDHNRRRKFRQFLSMDWLLSNSSDEEIESWHSNSSGQYQNVESLVETRQRLSNLADAIDALPHDLKTALTLYHLEEKSQSECAVLLGVTPKTVETRVYRARMALRKKLRLTDEG